MDLWLESLALPISFTETDDSDLDRIHSCLNADYCFRDGYQGKQPVALEEYCFKYRVLSLGWSGVQSLECSKGQLPRHNGTVCCEPYFNCGKNHMIKPCSGVNKKDQCVPCKEGEINNHVTSSIDDSWIRYQCFKSNTEAHKSCSPEDQLPYYKTTTNCALSCECDIYKCYYGNQCSCDQQTIPCGVDQELNTETGECVPCRLHTYKNVKGCQPCTWNETSWRISHGFTDVTLPEVSTKATQQVSITTLKEISTIENNTYAFTTEAGGPKNGHSKDQGPDEGGTRAWAIALAIAVLVIAAVIVAVILVRRKRRQSAAQTEEQGRAAANGGENGTGHEKPQLAVSPTPVTSVPTSDQEEVPFCDMSLNGNGHPQNESHRPLMTNDDTHEQTAQKML